MTHETDAPHPRFPSLTLQDHRFALRPLTEDDVPAVTACGSDELIQAWLPLPQPYTEEHARWFCVDFSAAQQQSGRGLVLGIEKDEKLAGAIDLKRTDWKARSTEIGYWTAPWARGQGVMTRALMVLSRWVLETQGLTRVEVRVAVDNTASARVAAGAGFTREGVLRRAGYTHSGPVDLIVYSLILGDLREPRN